MTIGDIDSNKESYVGGIPLDFENLAQKMKNGEITQQIVGESGDIVNVSLIQGIDADNDQEFWVFEIRNLDMSARYNAVWYANKDGRENWMDFSVYTRQLQSKKEPIHDLHAGKLVDATLGFIEKRHPIDAIKFLWRESDSVNYTEYVSARDETYRSLKEKGIEDAQALQVAQYDAAFATWEGRRIARKHGFNNLDSIREYKRNGDSCVEGFYSRPKTIKETALKIQP